MTSRVCFITDVLVPIPIAVIEFVQYATHFSVTPDFEFVQYATHCSVTTEFEFVQYATHCSVTPDFEFVQYATKANIYKPGLLELSQC